MLWKEMFKYTLLLISLILLSGCFSTSSKVEVGFNKKVDKTFNASVSSVQIINHQLVINGNGLNNVTKVVVNGQSLNEDFSIETKNNSKIIANSIHNLSFGVGKVFGLILSDAEASATFQIDFSLCQATLHGAGFDCDLSVNDNDVLTFDQASNKWVPRALGGLNYQGTWNANTATPTATLVGEYYIVNVANLPTYNISDWIVWNGTSYDHIVQSTGAGTITSVFGRIGTVVPVEGDYSLNQLLDVDLTTTPLIAGKILKYDGAKWIADDEAGGTPAAGSITSTELAANSVTDAKIVGISASKITGTMTSAQIADGAIVNADINAAAAIDYSKLNIPAASIPYAKLNIANGDIPAAKISGLPSSTAVLATAITDGDTTHAPDGNAVFDALGLKLNLTGGILSVGTISGVPTPTNNDDVANKGYTDTRDALKLAKAGDTMSGILTLDSDLKIKGGSNYVTVRGNAASAAYTLTLPVDAGANNQVLTTNGSGALTWTTPSTTAAPTGTAGGDLSGTYPNPTITALSAAKVGGGAVDNTEFSYLDGVTSAIQTQLNAKEGTLTQGVSTQYYRGDKAWATLTSDVATEGTTNYYFTAARAKAATVADAIADAVVDVAPSQNAVFDSLATKLNLTGGTLSVGTISGVPTPTTDDQVANKSYVDSTHSDGALIPANTVILMDSCGAGWTDQGIIAGGPGFVACTGAGVACHKCESPATPSRIPAGKILVLESCPSGWTNLGVTLGPGGAAKNIGLSKCQAPAYNTGLSLGSKVLAVACPASWQDHGITSPSTGATSAICGGGLQCRICSATGSNHPVVIEGNDAISATEAGLSVGLIAGTGGATSGAGGSVTIRAGSSTSGANAAGNVNISAGVNPGTINGNITLSSGSTTVGTAGYILLNPYNTTGRVGIGTDAPGKLLSVNGDLEALTVETPSLSAAVANTANLIVNGNITNSVVGQFRNAAVDGYSGISMTDSGSTAQGFLGYANASASSFPGSFVLSSLSGAPIVFSMLGFEAMKVAGNGELIMGGNVPPLTYRMTVANGSIDITSGGVRATAAYVQTSDIRLKAHINYVTSKTALEKITSLHGIYYDWKDQDKLGTERQLGLIAQEVQKVFPEAVKTDSEGFLSVGYGILIAPVIEAVKELNKRILDLFKVTDGHSRAIASIKAESVAKDQKIKKLEAENAEMKSRLDRIEKILNKSK